MPGGWALDADTGWVVKPQRYSRLIRSRMAPAVVPPATSGSAVALSVDRSARLYRTFHALGPKSINTPL